MHHKSIVTQVHIPHTSAFFSRDAYTCMKITLLCSCSDSMEEANGSGYFLVDPMIHAGKMDDRVPMDCLRCQTVLAKALGPFSEWQDRLCVAYEAGYNMIHFTPIQELGESNSSYCIRDQLTLNSAFSKVSRTSASF